MWFRPKWFGLGTMLLLLFHPALIAGTVIAAETPSAGASSEASPEESSKVALLAAACSGCHSKSATRDADPGVGTPAERIPQIYGRPATEIREALLDFRADKREGTVMNRIAKGYSIPEIDMLAEYLSKDSPGHADGASN